MGLIDEYGTDSEGETPPKTPQLQHPALVPTSPASQPLPLSEEAIHVATDEHTAPIVGPLRPPSTSPSPSPEPEEEQGPPLSPHSATRNLIHSLSLPTSIPPIPPSPPGSPPPSLVGKFSHFRSLKAQGVHFNEKLLRSSSLRNPNLLQKLTAFVGFDGADQYSTNLTSDLWDPAAFNEEAFVEQLAASQTKITEARERAKMEQARENVEFVGSVLVQPPPAQEQPKERMGESAAERVIKGLDRERKGVPSRRDRDDGMGSRRDDKNRRREDDKDRRRDDEYKDRRRDDDRERKRIRTRSRSRERDRGDRRHRDVEFRDRR